MAYFHDLYFAYKKHVFMYYVFYLWLLVREAGTVRQGSNFDPVFGEQCHLTHLTILGRLSWPSLAYMCTQVA